MLFETDVLIAEISVPALVHAILQTDRRTLEDTFADLFTSRSGFHSFYDPNPENLPFDFQDWDENQVGAILQAYTNTASARESVDEAVCEALRENGDLHNLVWEALPPEVQTLINELYEEECGNENDN